jgi:hypothetical protein
MGLLCTRILRRIANGQYNIANLLVTVLKNRGAMKQLGALVLTFRRIGKLDGNGYFDEDHAKRPKIW